LRKDGFLVEMGIQYIRILILNRPYFSEWEKKMKYLTAITLIFFIAVGLAGAGETFRESHDFGSDGLLWDYHSQAWTDNTSVSWIHTLAGFDSSASITKGSLPVPGNKLGFSDRTSGGFSAVPLKNMVDSTASISGDFPNHRFGWNSYHNNHGRRYANRIPMGTPNFLYPCDPKPVLPSPVPAPSAIIIGSIGICLVGKGF
jgi:hypothetical protein